MCVPAVIGGLTTLGAKIGTALGTAGAATGAFGNLATVAQIGAGVFGAVSQFQNARAAQKTANANAAAQDRAALEAMQEGERRSDQQRRAGAIMAGEQRAAMAANGVDLSSAHALDILDETKTLTEEDAFAIRSNSRSVAGQHSQRAANFRTDASSAGSASVFQPFQTILGTASKVGRRYSHMVTPQRGPSYG